MSIFEKICVNFSQARVDLTIIREIESNNNPYADNGIAFGLYGITKICLQEYNQFNNCTYVKEDLLNKYKNEKIAKWYIYKRLPDMIKAYNQKPTVKNIIIAYNGGIKYIKYKDLELPAETKNYLKKYENSLDIWQKICYNLEN